MGLMSFFAHRRHFTISYPSDVGTEYVRYEIFSDRVYPILNLLNLFGGDIVDVGANVGFASVWFAANFPRLTVHAFEPGAVALTYLRVNAERLPNMRVHDFALWDKDGELPLFSHKDSSVLASLVVDHGSGSALVRCRRACSAFADLGIKKIALLKLDTEGAEVALLHDLVDYLPRTGAVFVEHHSTPDRIEIEKLLGGRFVMTKHFSDVPDHGVLCFVARELISPVSTVVASQQKRLGSSKS